MPITALSPDAVIASANLRDAAFASPPEALADLGDDPASPDGDWWSPVDPAEAASARFGFPAPAGLLSGEQAFRVLLRKSAGTGNPTATLSLYEDGVLVRHLQSDVEITSAVGQIVTGTWDADEVSNPAAVEILLAMAPGIAAPVALDTGTWAVTQGAGVQTYDAAALFSGEALGFTIFQIVGASGSGATFGVSDGMGGYEAFTTPDGPLVTAGAGTLDVTLDAVTGEITADGDVLALMDGVTITIRATNSGGYADTTIAFSVVAVDGIGVGSWAIGTTFVVGPPGIGSATVGSTFEVA